MRATVFLGIYLAVAANCEQARAIVLEAAAATFSQRLRGA